MLNMKKSLTLLLFTSTLLSGLFPGVSGQCNEIAPAVIKGKRFYDSATGEYIPIKGINYYPRANTGGYSAKGVDFYSEDFRSVWERDIENFRKLGINTVRLYAVDPSKDHSGFMCSLKSAGIYVIVGLGSSCKDCSITMHEAPQCYPAGLKARGQQIINVFSKYDNVLAFSAGNEVALYAPDRDPEVNSPCQKQFIRDMRAYVKSCPQMRQIPVGVVTADVDREDNALYYNCRSDPDDELENAEWFGMNLYLHCNGRETDPTQISGWNTLQRDFQSYNLPVPTIVAEFGCPHQSFPTINGWEGQRDFLQVETLFSPSFQETFVGGIVFEYSAEKNHVDQWTDVSWPYKPYVEQRWGIGYMAPVNCNEEDIPCQYIPYPEFDRLATKYEAVDTSFVPSMNNYNPGNLDVTTCPDRFTPLSNFVWPSASEEDYWCADGASYVCPNTPPACLANTPDTAPPSSTAPVQEPTAEPSAANDSSSLTDTDVPTNEPDASAAPEPTAVPVMEEPEDSDTMAPSAVETTPPTPVPSAAEADEPTATPTTQETEEPTAEPTDAPSSKPVAADDEEPSEPDDPAVNAVSSSTVSLSWSASDDNVKVAEYHVYDGSELLGSTNKTSMMVTGLSPDSEYTLRIVAVDDAGNESPASESLTVTTHIRVDDFNDGDNVAEKGWGSWNTYQDGSNGDGSAILTTQVPGYTGYGARMSYAVDSGDTGVANLYLDFEEGNAIDLTESDITGIQFKMRSGDTDTTFYIQIGTPLAEWNWIYYKKELKPTTSWKTVVLLFDEFTADDESIPYTLKDALQTATTLVWETKDSGKTGWLAIDDVDLMTASSALIVAEADEEADEKDDETDDPFRDNPGLSSSSSSCTISNGLSLVLTACLLVARILQ